MKCLFLTHDLMAQSRLGGLASRLGMTLEVYGKLESLLGQAADGNCVVLLDLNAVQNLTELAAQLKALSPAPAGIVAFGPHVQEEALAAAQAAGCQVYTRGEFHARAEPILDQFTPR